MSSGERIGGDGGGGSSEWEKFAKEMSDPKRQEEFYKKAVDNTAKNMEEKLEENPATITEMFPYERKSTYLMDEPKRNKEAEDARIIDPATGKELMTERKLEQLRREDSERVWRGRFEREMARRFAPVAPPMPVPSPSDISSVQAQERVAKGDPGDGESAPTPPPTMPPQAKI